MKLKLNRRLLVIVWVVLILVFASQQVGYSQYTSIRASGFDYTVYLPIVMKQAGNSWAMAGANPERTSWTPEEIPGSLKPSWYKIFEPYIIPRTQIIAANAMLYISTADGLYALDAINGAEKWVYATDLPLGHSPTVKDGMVYVGGFDKKIHAINAQTGTGIWTFQAEAGFDTNPLVVEGKVFAGSRDGYFYAIHAVGANQGELAWKYKTQGPIHYSAAYKDGIVYFASNDSHAYALKAENGDIVWKSEKLPGAGFHSWWPVVYKDFVIFSGSQNIHDGEYIKGTSYVLEKEDLYPNRALDPEGTTVGPLGYAPGNWIAGTVTIDTSKPNITANGSTTPITEYLEKKPWRRTYFVFNRYTGKEYTTDFDKDGKPEYAPILWLGTRSGNRYPPIVGSDGVIYQANNYISNPSIPRGQISGWQIGTPFISIVTDSQNAVDEPVAYSAGGDIIYWNRCCDRVGASFDNSIPYDPNKVYGKRSYSYFTYNLAEILPGYNSMYYNPDGNSKSGYATYAGRNGIYGIHGDVNPPIPYMGKVYMHRSNAVIAFGPDTGNPVPLTPVEYVVFEGDIQNPSQAGIHARLEQEIMAIINAGHLRPGYLDTGLFENRADNICGEYLVDYWHHPGDIIYTLLRALPHLSPDIQQQTRAYIQSEFQNYPPYQYNHIGWQDGAAREFFDLPPEIEANLDTIAPKGPVWDFPGWKFAPHSFYAMWKYAVEFGGAKAIFDTAKVKLEPLPADSLLLEMPHVNNAFIAGYIGYLELQKMAGYPESSNIKNDLQHLLDLRTNSFSVEPPNSYFEDSSKIYCRTLNVSRNFMYLTPELGQYLHIHASSKVQAAVSEYERVAPLWFVSASETTFGEGVISPLFDYHSLFQAKALILQEPYEELGKYLDVSSMAVGDLFYIQNLTALLEISLAKDTPSQ